ncbi:MAG: hypothetical protein HON70_38535 [Lentisphaerae bacterium]|nr:hypothetical protein [Lentisphaerota bacterium]
MGSVLLVALGGCGGDSGEDANSAVIKTITPPPGSVVGPDTPIELVFTTDPGLVTISDRQVGSSGETRGFLPSAHFPVGFEPSLHERRTVVFTITWGTGHARDISYTVALPVPIRTTEVAAFDDPMTPVISIWFDGDPGTVQIAGEAPFRKEVRHNGTSVGVMIADLGLSAGMNAVPVSWDNGTATVSVRYFPHPRPSVVKWEPSRAEMCDTPGPYIAILDYPPVEVEAGNGCRILSHAGTRVVFDLTAEARRTGEFGFQWLGSGFSTQLNCP